MATSKPQISYGAGPGGALVVAIPVSARGDFQASVDLLVDTSASTPATLLAAAGLAVIDIPQGSTYALFDVKMDGSGVSQRPVISVWAVDGAGEISPIMSVAGDNQITFSGTVKQTGTSTYKIIPTAINQFLVDAQASTKLVIRVDTPATGVTTATLLVKVY